MATPSYQDYAVLFQNQAVAATSAPVPFAGAASGKVTLTIPAGTTATVRTESSDDGGRTWVPVRCMRADTEQDVANGTVTFSNDAGGTYKLVVSEPSAYLRLNITSISAGSITAYLTNSQGYAFPPALSATVSAPGTLADGVTPTIKATVAPFHNADNQNLGSGNGLNTGGVAQSVNPTGTLDRQRGTGFDGISNTGIVTGTQQLASPPLAATLTQTVTASSSPQTVSVSAVSFTFRGVAYSFQPNCTYNVGAGTSNQEFVFVTSVNASGKTITGVFKNNHASGDPVSTYAYSQAREATIPDGSSPQGVPASAANFWNGTLNVGAGGFELARSAAGELDGASGSGTNLAAAYEWNGGGPISNVGTISGLQFDRSRNLEAKGPGGSTLSGATGAGATSITLNGASGLQPGQKLRLDRNAATEEAAYVATGYSPGALTVPLQSALQFAHANTSTAEWDTHAAAGPGLSGFTPHGVGIEEEALFNPVDGKYYVERSATQDAVPLANVVMEGPALFNGTSGDRARSLSASGDGLGVELACQPSSIATAAAPAANTAATITYAAVTGQQHRLTLLAASYSGGAPAGGNITVQDGATTVLSLDVASTGPLIVPLPPGGIKGSINTAMTITLSAGGAGVSGKVSAAKLTA